MKSHASFQYSILGYICLACNLFITKLLYRRSRLIRFPFFVRGSKLIDFGANLTTGRHCRIDALTTPAITLSPAKTIVFGRNVQIGDRVHIAAAEKVIFGDDCLIASNVYVSDHDHGETDSASMLLSPSSRKLLASPVKIGNSCWIGQNVCILKGVTLGENCIVAAGAVVTRSFPAYSVIAGVPARLLKTVQPAQQS